jgi:hypothetical protein
MYQSINRDPEPQFDVELKLHNQHLLAPTIMRLRVSARSHRVLEDRISLAAISIEAHACLEIWGWRAAASGSDLAAVAWEPPPSQWMMGIEQARESWAHKVGMMEDERLRRKQAKEAVAMNPSIRHQSTG